MTILPSVYDPVVLAYIDTARGNPSMNPSGKQAGVPDDEVNLLIGRALWFWNSQWWAELVLHLVCLDRSGDLWVGAPQAHEPFRAAQQERLLELP